MCQSQRSRFKTIETALGMLEGDGDDLVDRDVDESKTNSSTCLSIYPNNQFSRVLQKTS